MYKFAYEDNLAMRCKQMLSMSDQFILFAIYYEIDLFISVTYVYYSIEMVEPNKKRNAAVMYVCYVTNV